MWFCRGCMALLYRLMRQELTEERWAVWEQFIKFVLVGCSNTVVVLIVYYLVVWIAGTEYYLAGQTLGYFIGILNSYFWNSRYVFTQQKKKTGNSFVKMCLCYVLTYFIQIGLLYGMVDVMQMSELIAPVIAILITTPINFVLNKVFAF